MLPPGSRCIRKFSYSLRLATSPQIESAVITRQIDSQTNIPARPRRDVINYVVEAGDSLFGIAEKFGITPETVLWGNQFVLGDDPAFVTSRTRIAYFTGERRIAICAARRHDRGTGLGIPHIGRCDRTLAGERT